MSCHAVFALHHLMLASRALLLLRSRKRSSSNPAKLLKMLATITRSTFQPPRLDFLANFEVALQGWALVFSKSTVLQERTRVAEKCIWVYCEALPAHLFPLLFVLKASRAYPCSNSVKHTSAYLSMRQHTLISALEASSEYPCRACPKVSARDALHRLIFS